MIYSRRLALTVFFAIPMGFVSASHSAVSDIQRAEKKVLFTVPACRMPGKAGALVYHRSGGFNEMARGLAVSDGHVYLWDSTRLQEFDQSGKFLRQYLPPDPTWRMGAAAVGKGRKVYMRVYTGTNSPSLLIFEPDQAAAKQLPLPKGTQGLNADAQGHLWIFADGLQGAYELDEEGRVIAKRPSAWRSGPWFVTLEYRAGFVLRTYDTRGAEAGSLSLPKDKYPFPRLLQYYDGQTYLGVFGPEPEAVRSLTLYSISPKGLAHKIKLPARVLFGGSYRQLMPDGTKYYLEYIGERGSYQLVMERYTLRTK